MFSYTSKKKMKIVSGCRDLFCLKGNLPTNKKSYTNSHVEFAESICNYKTN